MPKVSVLIPTYNCSQYIGQAINSVLNQSFSDFEIIISDNASTDNTEDIVRNFNDPRIKYYKNNENIGYTKNVHKLIHELASGEYCIILCADDYWDSNQLLFKFCKILDDNHKVGFVYSKNKFLNENVGYLSIHNYSNNIFIIDGKEFFLNFRKKYSQPALSSGMFRRSLALEVGAFEENLKYCPDLVFWLKLSLSSYVAFIDTPFSVYRVGIYNLTHTFDYEYRYSEVIKSIELIKNYALKKGINDKDMEIWEKEQKKITLINYLKELIVLKSERGINYIQFVKKLYTEFSKLDTKCFLSPYISALFILLFMPRWILKPLRICQQNIYKILKKKKVIKI